jgi:hypothetical protein
VARNHQSVRVSFGHDGVQNVLSDRLQGTVRAAAILHNLDQVHAIITGRQLADHLSCLIRGGMGLRFESRAGEHRRTDQGESASLRRTCRIERRKIEDHTAGSHEQRGTDPDENPAPSHRHSMTSLRIAYLVLASPADDADQVSKAKWLSDWRPDFLEQAVPVPPCAVQPHEASPQALREGGRLLRCAL